MQKNRLSGRFWYLTPLSKSNIDMLNISRTMRLPFRSFLLYFPSCVMKANMMNIKSHKQAEVNIAGRLGFWAAIVVSVLNVWFFIAYGLYQPIQMAAWHGLSQFAAEFRPLPLLAWVIPCLILAPAFLIMVCCIHYYTEMERKIWSILAICFAVSYTTLMSVNYYIQLTVVQHNLLEGKTDGLLLWLYAYSYPRSFPGAFEGVAYGFMCIAFLLSSQAFGQGKLKQWVKWTFIGAGITGSVVFIDPLFRLPMTVLMVDGFFAAIFLIGAPILLAILFRRIMSPTPRVDPESANLSA